MATVTWNANKDTSLLSPNQGNGACAHLPIGTWSGLLFRAQVGFSYSFAGMTAITGAVLHMRTTTQYHVGFSADPDVLVRRITQSWSEGTAGGSETWSTSNSTTYPGSGVTSNNEVNWDVVTSEDTWDSVDITGIIQDAFAAGVFYGLKFYAVNESSGDTIEFWSTEKGSSYDAYIVVTYSTNTVPNAPTGMAPTGDAVVDTLNPVLQGIYSDPDPLDTAYGAQYLVYTDAGLLIWDSGEVGTAAPVGGGFSTVYAGPALTGNTFYKFQARTKDAAGAWGNYCGLQRFKVNSPPSAPTISITESPTSDLKTLTPTLNVTHVDPDASDTQLSGYHIIVETAAGSGVYDSGDVSVSPVTTKSVVYPGAALSWQTGYRWRARTKDSNGSWGSYSSNQTFTTHTTGVPISLSPTGGATASSITPTLSGARASSADTLASAQVQVYASNGTTLIWDSGTFTSGVSSGAFSKVYAGTALSASTTYKWRALVTGTIGGTSAWSALQTFVTPDATAPTQTTPLGTGVTPVTSLPFTFTRGTNFNRHELYVYSDALGTSLVTSDTPSAYTATGSKTFTYGGTLAWNTTYYWKVRVSSDGGTNYSPFAGLTAFTTDAAGTPTIVAPADGAWLGAPDEVDSYDNITGFTNGANLTASAEGTLFQTGRGSVKLTASSLNGIQEAYRTVAKDLSKYGGQTPIKIYARISSLTSVTYVRVRFTFATASDFAEYTITPSGANTWEQKTVTKGSPTATGGTVNWANVTRIGIRVSTGASVSPLIYVDNLLFDNTAPSFDGTTSGGETITTYRILVFAADQTTLVWDSGEVAGSSTAFSKLYAGSALSKGVQYFWQARYTKSTGPTGNYSPLRSFLLNSDPSVPSGLNPASGGVYPDSLTVHFKSTFTDAEKGTLGDFPTMYEVEVYRASDSVLVYSILADSGLTSGENDIYDGLSGSLKVTGAASPLVYETNYQYRVRYRDSKGAIGVWSSYVPFKPSQSPTATISTPSNGGTVSSPSFNITWAQSSPGGKVQNSYRVRVVRDVDAVTIYDTGQVFSSATTFVMPAGYMLNTLSYSIMVNTWDSDGLISTTDTNVVTADWAAPDAIADFVASDDPDNSAVDMSWTASNLAAVNFRKYVIYRKVAAATEWSAWVDITNQATTSYTDYLAANTVVYQYKITQLQVVPGDVDLESDDSDIAEVILDSDNWFVVGADRQASHIFDLPVTQGPFQEPVQQEIFEPLGTTRKVIIRGKVLGAEGQLVCKWADSERETAIAQVTYIKSNAGPHILKSPFGDLWLVEFSGTNKDYQVGGHITMNINWTEVA